MNRDVGQKKYYDDPGLMRAYQSPHPTLLKPYIKSSSEPYAHLPAAWRQSDADRSPAGSAAPPAAVQGLILLLLLYVLLRFRIQVHECNLLMEFDH